MCGAVTITAEPARQSLIVCHCAMCRRWSSSAFIAMNAEADSVTVAGPAKVIQSSDWAERAFCEKCGSNLWYRITAEGPGHGQYQLAAGLFDVNGMHVGLELFIDEKPDAYTIEGGESRRQMTAQEVYDLYAPKDNGEAQ